MASQPSCSHHPIRDAYETDHLGGAGEEYSRLIAIHLLSRAAIEDRQFRLGIELKAAGKFDDVAFYNESAAEWWLIQAKHSLSAKEVTREEMFTKDATTGDFSMVKYFKSYLHVKQHWQYGGARIRLFLFTNRPLQGSVERASAEVDEMLMFAGGSHVHLVPSQEDINIISNFVNYTELCDAFFKLFVKGDGRVTKVLKNHSKMVRKVLTKERNKLKFSESFLRNNPNSELHTMLKSAFAKNTDNLSTLSVVAPGRFPDFWSNSTEDADLPLVDDDIVKKFFSNLVLSVSQPNVRRLEEGINADWRRWMKSWIRPDVFRRLTADQLSETFNTFKGCFSDWEQPYEKLNERLFMTGNESAKCLETVKDKLNSYVQLYGRHGYVGLDAAEEYYVSRRITLGKRFYRWNSNLRQELANECKTDEEFVEWLCEDWTTQQCVVLFAEPGMGKSTLWQHLAFQTQKNHANVEVFLIYLNDLKAQLQSVAEGTSVEHAASILKAVISAEHLKLLLDKQQRNIIFMDAFDELKEENIHSILNLVTNFKRNNSNVKFLISSRDRLKQQLEENLQVERIDLVPLDEANRRDFLRLFWKAEKDTKFDAFSERLLNKFECEVPRADIDFIGLPLTMKMLAEVFQDSFREYVESKSAAEPKLLLSKVSINIIYLYEQFITKCISLTLNKTEKIDVNAKSFLRKFAPQIRSTRQNYELLAMERMKLNHLIEDTQKEQLEEFRESIGEGIEESLLLETVNGKAQFAHLSYAEFFCATYLFDQLSDSGAIRGGNLVEVFKKHTVVRRFFLMILDMKLGSSESKQSDRLNVIVEILEKAKHELAVWASDYDCTNLLASVLSAYELDHEYKKIGTLLHIAANSNACGAGKILLDVGAKIDARNSSFYTPLSVACSEGHLNMVKLLVERGADLQPSFPFKSPLKVAINLRHMEIIEHLISNAAGMKIGNYRIFTKQRRRNEIKNIALLYAAEMGHLDIVQMLIARGARPDYCDSDQRTALHFATSTEVVKELLKNGANVNAKDRCGATPLNYAARNYDFQIAQCLLKRGATIVVTDAEQPVLHIAAFLGLSSVIEASKDELTNCHLSRTNMQWYTPLHAAVAGKQLNDVRLLLAKGANVNAVEINTGEIVLHLAALIGEIALVVVFCESGANIDAQSKSGNTPLHFAAAKGHADVVRELITRGADVNLINSWDKQTPLHLAAANNRTAVVEELLKGGAEVNKKDWDGKTALDLATAERHADIVRLLEVHREPIRKSLGRKLSQLLSLNKR